jgi:hypothetical protein
MKRKILFPVFVVVLAVALTIPMALVSAHEENDPYVMDLLAGQFEDVGDVKVWNDGDNLYITYELTDLDWTIMETHLYVGKNVAPTTAPGQFPYDDDDATSVSDTTVDYTIPLDDIDSYSMKLNNKGKPTGVMVADGSPGVEPCNNIYIAAHAVVEKTETFNDCLVSGADSDMVLYLAEDSSNPGYPTGYTAPYQTYAGTPTSSVLAWTHSAWGPYGVPGAEWISSSYYTENTDNNTWRLFTRSFNLSVDATNIAGTLTMNCDNAQLVHLNDGYVGEDTYAPTTKIYGIPVPPSGNAHGWNSVESWDISSLLAEGPNELWTMTRNYAWSGGPTANPTGLIYKLCYSYDIVTTETAWGSGFLFEGRNNWAMHFPYHVQPVPCMTPGGDLSITGTGWKSVTAWCPCAYTYDLTDAGEPIALQGWVDLSEAAIANPLPDWSKYYGMFRITDNSGKFVQVVFNNDYLGPWYEIPSVPWDRIRMENNMGLALPERWYVTVGGVLGYDMDGYWVGEGNGATVYPSDQYYFFQLIADPIAETFTLQIYGMGSGAQVADPPPSAKPGWPKQNMYDYPTWLELGTITTTGFDFSEVTICAILWASTQAGAEETTTIYWDGMTVDTPVIFGEIPEQ